jgi:predicted nucleic-acid-binding Zn-ribbon protein
MSDERITCPKCDGEMVRGFVPDYAHGGILVGGWQEGRPKKSFWTTTKVSRSTGIPIGVFRCARCGFLEFYADKRFAAE